MTYTLDIKPEEVLVYSRKSRTDDPMLTVEEVLAKHETIIDELSERVLGGKVPEENKYREIVSGETIKDRPEIQKVLKQIESPRYKAILIVEVQRLSRGDLEDAGKLIKLIRYTNTLVITQQKTYNLHDEYDRDAFERELKRGNEFLEYQKKIMNRGRLLAVQRGDYIGSIAPYGYDKIEITEDKRKCHTLKINEKEADAVRMIFDMYVNQDMGRMSIAHRLNDLGIKPRKSELWAQDAIKGILENVHYIGKVKWNWRKTINIVEDGEINKSRPKSKIDEYLVYDGKHEPIISDELFAAARAKQGRNHRAKAKTKVRNPLAGLVFCQCGRAMSMRTYMKDGVERSAPRLLCDNQTYCKTSSVMYQEIVDRVCKVLEECVADFEMRIANDNSDSVKLHNNLIARLKTTLDELNKKEINQWEKYTEEGMPKHIFDKLNEKVLKEKEEVQQALCKAYESMPDPVDYEEKLLRFKDALEAINNPDVPAARKNTLLKACIDRIDYSRGKSYIGTKEENGLPENADWQKSNKWINAPIELDVKLRV